MKSLKILMHLDGNNSNLLGVIEDLASITEECLGSSSPITLAILIDLGCSYMNVDEIEKAADVFSQTLVKLRRAKSASAKDVADLLRRSSWCRPRTELSRAMILAARTIEKNFGIVSAEDFALHIFFTATGQRPEPDMVPAEAIKCLERWFDEQEKKASIPFIDIPSSNQVRFQKLLPLIERAKIAADVIEANDSHPLCRMSIRSQWSEVMLELGEVTRAKELREEQISMLKRYWGDDHVMTRDAMAELEKLASM